MLLSEKLLIVAHLAKALQLLHASAHLVHMDVRPENVLYDPSSCHVTLGTLCFTFQCLARAMAANASVFADSGCFGRRLIYWISPPV